MNILKAIRLGVKDYCEDCWHDWHLRCLEKAYGELPMFYMSENEDVWVAIIDWKEGNLWHYIKQAKLIKRKENAKNNH